MTCYLHTKRTQKKKRKIHHHKHYDNDNLCQDVSYLNNDGENIIMGKIMLWIFCLSLINANDKNLYITYMMIMAMIELYKSIHK